MMQRVCVLGFVLLVAFGCAARQTERELAGVAKDWSMVVRASQEMPVYPLTEDLQHGDVFLVQLPVDEQQKAYREKGFLAFDNLIDRLKPAGFAQFYATSFGAGGTDKQLPKYWLTPGEANAWAIAPSASFSTYSFSVRSGGGFSLALPVQGVPVGLSLLGGQAARARSRSPMRIPMEWIHCRSMRIFAGGRRTSTSSSATTDPRAGARTTSELSAGSS